MDATLEQQVEESRAVRKQLAAERCEHRPRCPLFECALCRRFHPECWLAPANDDDVSAMRCAEDCE